MIVQPTGEVVAPAAAGPVVVLLATDVDSPEPFRRAASCVARAVRPGRLEALRAESDDAAVGWQACALAASALLGGPLLVQTVLGLLA